MLKHNFYNLFPFLKEQARGWGGGAYVVNLQIKIALKQHAYKHPWNDR